MINKRNILIALYLFVVGILAVNIHIQMLKAGIPYPGKYFTAPDWDNMVKAIIQLLGVLWLVSKLSNTKVTWSVSRKIIVVFFIMAAMMELLLRLPLTAGYVNGQAFLFTWAAAYLPKLMWLLLSVTVVVLLSLQNKKGQYSHIFVRLVILAVYAVLSVIFFMPLFTALCSKLLPFLTPPDPANIIPWPYNFTTTIIASIFYIEPVIACFIVASFIWDEKAGFLSQLTKVTFIILILNQGLVKFIVFMFYNSLPLSQALLCIGQFTLGSIFIGIMVSGLLFYLRRDSALI